MDNYELFVKKFVDLFKDELIQLRREFHKFPEIGFEETKTSEMIKEYLTKIGISNIVEIASTGVIVDLNSHIKDYCIAIRVDMDALPINEETNLEFKSLSPNRMHACGHDGHITIGLGLIRVLNEIKDSIQSRIRFIFQPAEEGLGGAKQMVLEGALQKPKPDIILGFHIWPYLNTGEIGIIEGPTMAAGDKFLVRLIGEEGHGSTPHLAIDPTIMAAEVIQGFQNIVGRKVNALDPAVISVGTIKSGNSFNTIPAEVTITGTTRYIQKYLKEFLKDNMELLIKSVTGLNGGTYEFNYESCFELTTSDKRLVKTFKSTLNDKGISKNLVVFNNPIMASEDFSEYEIYVPGLYFFIGTRNEEKGCIYPLHSSKYMIDEDVIPKSIELLCYLIEGYVGKEGC